MRTAYCKYILALLLFGSNGVVASHIGLSSYEIVLLRSVLGGAVLAAIYFLSGHRFLCKIVRNLSLMRYHGDRTAKRGGGSYTVALEELEGCLASPRTVEGELEEQELVRLIEDFLEALSPENRVLLMRRYWFSDSYGEIAAQTGLSEKNVASRTSDLGSVIT